MCFFSVNNLLKATEHFSSYPLPKIGTIMNLKFEVLGYGMYYARLKTVMVFLFITVPL